MSDTKLLGLFAIGGGTLGGILAAYQVFLAAPAAVAARPELADLGFWTALFSGRFMSWFYFHYPVIATAFAVVFTATMTVVAVVFSK
jgi:hypothetical protein